MLHKTETSLRSITMLRPEYNSTPQTVPTLASAANFAKTTESPPSGPRVIAALPLRDTGEHRATAGDPTRSLGELLANVCYYQNYYVYLLNPCFATFPFNPITPLVSRFN